MTEVCTHDFTIMNQVIGQLSYRIIFLLFYVSQGCAIEYWSEAARTKRRGGPRRGPGTAPRWGLWGAKPPRS